MISDPPVKEEKKGLPRWLLILFFVCIMVALLAVSFYAVMAALMLGTPAKMPGLGDFAALLFGASSIALIIFSLLFAGVAVSGWQSLKNDVRQEVEAATFKRIEKLENEFRGKLFSIFGFMIGALHSNPTQLDQGENKDYLSEAVDHSRKAYNILEKSEGSAKYTALNNLVYYSCLSGEVTARDYLLEQAKVLKRVGQEKNFSDYLLTYCRAMLQYSLKLEELQDASSIAAAMLQTNLSERQKKEATFYVASLTAKINSSPGKKATSHQGR